MANLAKLVSAIVIGNILTVATLLFTSHLGFGRPLVLLLNTDTDMIDTSTGARELKSPMRASPALYSARVPIPGHPIEYCLGPERELNVTVQKCTSMKVISVTSAEPITDAVENARKMLESACEGGLDSSLSREQQQEWCDLHVRMQLYGHTIAPVVGTRID